MDRIDFSNTLATLKLSTAMCHGFEEEAYAAMLGLIFFRLMTTSGRIAFDRAVSKKILDRDVMNRFGSRNIFYQQIQQLRRSAYQNAVDLQEIDNAYFLVANPWCLTNTEFHHCRAYLDDDNTPQLSQFDKTILNSDRLFFAGEMSGIAQLFGKLVLDKYWPNLFEGLAVDTSMMSPALAVGSVLTAAFQYGAQKITIADLRRRYEVDLVRRNHLYGMSAFGPLASAG
ncbi:MAG TPA: hypothetical protein VL574_05575 [Stellaceae bacterium]|jgi:hypothetical protein|nr:hypothetical protein [Stellaceae bacterium]